MNNTEDLREKIFQEIEAAGFFGLVNVSVRVGKTLIGIKVCDKVKKDDDFRILWVTKDTHTRDNALPDEFRKYNYDYLLPFSDFCCWNSLPKMTGEYTIIILDEPQHITVINSITLLNKSLRAEYMLGLTGTPPKDHIKKYILKKLGLKEITKVTIDEAVDAQIISNYKINVLKFALDDTDKKFNEKSKTELQKYNSLCNWIEVSKMTNSFKEKAKGEDLRRQLLYTSVARKELLREISGNFKLSNQRGIVFTSFKKDAESLKHFYHSTSTEKYYDQFAEGTLNQLALVKKGSVAHTYYDIDYIIVSQLTKDFTGATTQSWGRGLMYREGITVQVLIFCAKDTVEESWLKSALENVDPNKVNTYYV